MSPGLRDAQIIWGERVAVRSEKKALEREFSGARVIAIDRDDLGTIATMPVDLLISYYTGPEPAWRVDDIADHVAGVTPTSGFSPRSRPRAPRRVPG